MCSLGAHVGVSLEIKESRRRSRSEGRYQLWFYERSVQETEVFSGHLEIWVRGLWMLKKFELPF